MLDSQYCCIVGGSRNLLNNCIYSNIQGSENVVTDSVGSSAYGYQNNIKGNYSFIEGVNNKILKSYSKARGKEAISNNNGAEVIGHVNDLQLTKVSLDRTTTNSSEGILKDMGGGSLVNTRDNAVVRVYGKCTATDGTDYHTFDIDCLVKTTDGASQVIDSKISTQFNTSGAISWSLRVQNSNNGFFIKATGEADKTIRWFASVEMQEVYSK